MTRAEYQKAKKQFIKEIIESLETSGRCIVRDLGTFRVVEHKAKENNLGKIPARKLVKFTATREIKERLN
jgi:nucleoid DNA-binding protein